MDSHDRLMRLTSIGASLVTDEYLSDSDAGALDRPEAVEELSTPIPLAGFHEAVTDSIAKSVKDPPAGDAALAEAVRRRLQIPRRLAMDVRVWHFLACVARPDYVRYRWGGGGEVSRERFLGSIKRNAFARLWWCAEVMRTGEDYSGVAACFEHQDIYEAVFGRAFSKFPPAAKAFVDVVQQQGRMVVREVAKDLNFMLSTLVLEDLSDAQIRGLVADRIECRAKNASQKQK